MQHFRAWLDIGAICLTAIVFVYDYHPHSSTLFDQHLSPQAVQAALRNPSRHPHHYNPHSINERVLWTYVCQLANVIKTVHSAGLAVRTIELSKILVTGKNRLRVNCCSILDVIRAGDETQPASISNQQVRTVTCLAYNKPKRVQYAYSKKTSLT